MATVAELINKGSCGGDSAVGFNVANGCLASFADTKTIWRLTPGTYLDPAQTLNEAYIDTLIIDGKLDILKGVRTFTEDGNDDAIETLDDDTQELTNEGKYRFSAEFKNGMYFNKALHSTKGFGNSAYSMIDRNGTIVMTKRNAGGARGFTTGLSNPGKLAFPSNTTSLRQKLMFQLLERSEVDEDFVLINKSDLDFNPVTKEGVNQIEISFVNAPAVSDTTITFKAVLAQDQKTPFTGAVANDIRLTIDGTPTAITPTPVAGKDGEYTATVTALTATQVLALKVYNSTDSKNVILKDGQFYKSIEVSETV